MVLHTVNKSAFDNSALGDCLRVVDENDAVLLIENGVYAALDSSPSELAHIESIKQLSASGTRFYVLQADCEARGLDGSTLLSSVKITDDAGFVALAAKASTIQSWY
ncbi:MAG: sulfurtransferase complex subunit TusB [Candidatus Reddybacter sp.]